MQSFTCSHYCVQVHQIAQTIKLQEEDQCVKGSNPIERYLVAWLISLLIAIDRLAKTLVLWNRTGGGGDVIKNEIKIIYSS